MKLNEADRSFTDRTRIELEHDFEQGDYITGGVLEGRIDWDELDTLVQHTRSMLDSWIQEREVGVAYSGGVDAMVMVHLLYDLGHTDIPLATSATPEMHPTHREYTAEMADRFGFEHVEYVSEEYDAAWVMENKARHLWPSKDVRWQQITMTYHRHMKQFFADYDLNMTLSGSRSEHNTTTQYVRDRPFCPPDCYEGCILKDWDISHVLAYLTKHEIPIDPLYRLHSDGTSHTWHGHRSFNRDGTRIATAEELFYIERETCLQLGYTEFWTDHILSYCPEAEAQALDWAMSQNKEFTEIEAGYKLGADANPVVPDWFDPGR